MPHHFSIRISTPLLLTSLITAASVASLSAAQPIRALLITGGCCHDYAHQKDILKQGLEQRANIVVDQVHTRLWLFSGIPITPKDMMS